MARRYARSRRGRRQLRVKLRGSERGLFILGATLYVIGVFGGLGFLEMTPITAIVLLTLGGGLEFAVMLMLIL